MANEGIARVWIGWATHEDGDNPLKLLRGELTSTALTLAQSPKATIRIREVIVPLVEINIGLLEDKVGVLSILLACVSAILAWRDDSLPDDRHPLSW